MIFSGSTIVCSKTFGVVIAFVFLFQINILLSHLMFFVTKSRYENVKKWKIWILFILDI